MVPNQSYLDWISLHSNYSGFQLPKTGAPSTEQVINRSPTTIQDQLDACTTIHFDFVFFRFRRIDEDAHYNRCPFASPIPCSRSNEQHERFCQGLQLPGGCTDESKAEVWSVVVCAAQNNKDSYTIFNEN